MKIIKNKNAHNGNWPEEVNSCKLGIINNNDNATEPANKTISNFGDTSHREEG